MTLQQMYDIRTVENKQLRRVIDQLIKENKILKEALKLACEQLTFGEDYVKMFMEDYIKQAKEEKK